MTSSVSTVAFIVLNECFVWDWSSSLCFALCTVYALSVSCTYDSLFVIVLFLKVVLGTPKDTMGLYIGVFMSMIFQPPPPKSEVIDE